MKNFPIVLLTLLCTTSCKKDGEDISPCAEFADLVCNCDSDAASFACDIAEGFVTAEKEDKEDSDTWKFTCNLAIASFEDEGGCAQFQSADDTGG